MNISVLPKSKSSVGIWPHNFFNTTNTFFIMSLYHEAAEILTSSQKNGGSLKSIVFGKKTWKSDPKALFALTTETAKWSVVLSEVLEKSGVLKIEKKITPTLALLLVHDLFLAKRGIALPATHGLHSSIARHKARLSAELTKARIRRGKQ